MGCVLLYLQKEGGLGTRQGRRVEVAEKKDGGFTKQTCKLVDDWVTTTWDVMKNKVAPG